jgi:molybdate transport system ATP-binding protein
VAEIRARFRKQFGTFRLDVDLRLPTRGVSVLFGRSGSGKTTLLRCMAGLEQSADGYFVIDNEVWQDGKYSLPTHQRALGYVFQDARLFPHLDVAANLDFGRRRAGPGALRVDRGDIIDLLGIEHLLARLPDRLSGGEQQRVAIARALLTAPKLLLMDEPLAALDHARKQEILPYLERLHEQLEIPIVYVSHAPEEVARLADHLVLLENGRVSAHGPTSETMARLDLPLRFGDEAGVVFDATVLARDAEWHLAHVAFAGGELWVRDTGAAVGRHVRLRVLARDVSIALVETDSSILNSLPAVVDDHAADDHPALVIVRLRVGEMPLLARLTRRSAAALQLAKQQRVWVQIKAVALIG